MRVYFVLVIVILDMAIYWDNARNAIPPQIANFVQELKLDNVHNVRMDIFLKMEIV